MTDKDAMETAVSNLRTIKTLIDNGEIRAAKRLLEFLLTRLPRGNHAQDLESALNRVDFLTGTTK